jgi:hypothetical protein
MDLLKVSSRLLATCEASGLLAGGDAGEAGNLASGMLTDPGKDLMYEGTDEGG